MCVCNIALLYHSDAQLVMFHLLIGLCDCSPESWYYERGTNTVCKWRP